MSSNINLNQSLSQPSFLFLLADDIGWADFGYNNGTALTPNLNAWAKSKGSVLLQDFHSGGTVCSPTRATVLTGRNHFRDCVDFVYGCSDMRSCPQLDFEFAPSSTFTVGDAFRMAHNDTKDPDMTYFAGKWHLGSFFNDSKTYGGVTSSPLTHGFTKMNATIEVAPTATTNCQCRAEWLELCDFGHYYQPNHCYPDGECCFNYWWDDPMAPHGVNNLTWPTPPDDSLYLADAFSRYIRERSRKQKPFLAQISFHNCHIPFIASKEAKEACSRGETCRLPREGEPPFTDEELDYYACLNELDNAIGIILDLLKEEGYYDNTMVRLGSSLRMLAIWMPASIHTSANLHTLLSSFFNSINLDMVCHRQWTRNELPSRRNLRTFGSRSATPQRRTWNRWAVAGKEAGHLRGRSSRSWHHLLPLGNELSGRESCVLGNGYNYGLSSDRHGSPGC